MPQNLPPEILKRIVICMMAFPPPPGQLSDTRPEEGVVLHTWNKIYQPRHLYRLACTCKYIKSIVDPMLFENWACYEKLKVPRKKTKKNKSSLARMHGLNWGCAEIQGICKKVDVFPTWYFNSKPVVDKPESLDSSKWPESLERNPKFYLVAGYGDMPRSALKHVKSMCIVFNSFSTPHDMYLKLFLTHMTSLQRVTIHVEIVVDSGGPRDTSSQEFTKEIGRAIYDLKWYRNIVPAELCLKIHQKTHKDMDDAYARVLNSLESQIDGLVMDLAFWTDSQRLKPHSDKVTEIHNRGSSDPIGTFEAIYESQEPSKNDSYWVYLRQVTRGKLHF